MLEYYYNYCVYYLYQYYDTIKYQIQINLI